MPEEANKAEAKPVEAKNEQSNEQPKSGEVVGGAKGELSGGATAGISVGIGVGNVCCGPMCYCMPSLISSIVGFVLYFMWKEEKPKTAKTILTVTLVTAGIALLFFGLMFAFGFTSALLEELNY